MAVKFFTARPDRQTTRPPPRPRPRGTRTCSCSQTRAAWALPAGGSAPHSRPEGIWPPADDRPVRLEKTSRSVREAGGSPHPERAAWRSLPGRKVAEDGHGHHQRHLLGAYSRHPSEAAGRNHLLRLVWAACSPRPSPAWLHPDLSDPPEKDPKKKIRSVCRRSNRPVRLRVEPAQVSVPSRFNLGTGRKGPPFVMQKKVPKRTGRCPRSPIKES